MPLNLGIFLAAPVLLTRTHKKKNSLKKVSLACLLLGILVLGYINFLLAGIHIRYVSDLSLALSLCAFLLILDQIHFDGTRSARILYVIVLCALLLTVCRGLLVIFSNETNDVLFNNPDFYLKISRISVSYTHLDVYKRQGHDDGGADAPKAHQQILFHLFRFSFAYSVGVLPVAFLKETLK